MGTETMSGVRGKPVASYETTDEYGSHNVEVEHGTRHANRYIITSARCGVQYIGGEHDQRNTLDHSRMIPSKQRPRAGELRESVDTNRRTDRTRTVLWTLGVTTPYQREVSK